MPEGDVVRLAALRLGGVLEGRVLERAELRWPSVAEAGLVGARVEEVASYGKQLLMRLDDARTLRTHLRMDGFWRVHPTTDLGRRDADPAVRAVLAADGWTALGYRLGMVDVVRTRDEAVLTGHLGPDLLADDFEEAGLPAAVDRLREADARGGWGGERPAAEGLPVCEALLRQEGVAGLGTIYTSESLFVRRVWPWRRVRDVGDGELAAVLRVARTLELQAVEAVRSHGRFPRRYVYGNDGRPCPRCGTAVRVGTANEAPYERQIFWCPRCQAPDAHDAPFVVRPFDARPERRRRSG